MDKKEIILIGGGGHCKSCIEVIESTNDFTIGGIIDAPDKLGEEVLGYKVIGSDEDLKVLRDKYKYAIVTVGQIKSPSLRKKLFLKAKEIGFNFPVIIASTAYVSKHCIIGEGTIIMHHALINSNVKIGKNNIINSKALIEHDAIIGDNNHISTSTVLNGNVKVGDGCFIGSNSTSKQGVVIANNIVVGLNSKVTKDLTEEGIYIGQPLIKK